MFLPLVAFITCVNSVLLEQRPEWTACIADPSTCTSLPLSGKNIEGTIPSAIGALTALQNLCVLDDGREPICPPNVIVAPLLAPRAAWPPLLTLPLPRLHLPPRHGW